ncbi:hypothetical protein [Jannaschia sp. 2305UL9-9]|uniref:hypothetical protein n=1 Tax=Jannaschia sp. 2305UL9-9 TaxID=3121638 RepID=UPI003529176C
MSADRPAILTTGVCDPPDPVAVDHRMPRARDDMRLAPPVCQAAPEQEGLDLPLSVA